MRWRPITQRSLVEMPIVQFCFLAAEMFKKISIAYAVLSDPNKRRQYDVSGPSSALTDFEGLDISELGGVGKDFSLYLLKLARKNEIKINVKNLFVSQFLAINFCKL